MSAQVVLPFQRMCRTCMTEQRQPAAVLPPTCEDWQSIYDFSVKDEETRAMRIIELLVCSIPQLLIQPMDELPQLICPQCVEKLVGAHQFQQMCLRSDQHMRNLLDTNAWEAKDSAANELPLAPACVLEDPLQGGAPVEELKDWLKLEVSDKDEDHLQLDCATPIAPLIDKRANDEGVKVDKVQESTLSSRCRSRRTCAQRKIEEPATKDKISDLDDSGSDNDCNFNSSIEFSEDYDSAKMKPQKRPRKKKERLKKCSPLKDSVNKKDKDNQVKQEKIDNQLEKELRDNQEVQINASDPASTPPTELKPEGFKCNECPQRFAKRDSLREHKKTHNKFSCKLCDEKFRTFHAFTKHMRNHGSEQTLDPNSKEESAKTHVCQYCNKAFHQSCTLKDHIRTHTGEQPFLCSECGRAFNSSSNMKQHLMRHSGLKRYECPECPKKFPCLSDLASHKAVHKKIKPHTCDLCGASFGKPYQLKKHKMYHNGEKPHKCEYCEMRFVCADHMRRHMRTHTGEKPYKCKYCVKAFAQSNDLIKHLRQHLGDLVYKCELCPRGFRLATELREHFADHKNDDDETKERNLQALQEQETKLKLSFAAKA